MELWIRTQSKQSLVKVDNVSITEQTKTRYNVESGEWILGRYNSFERAFEVLDEIQNILKPKTIVLKDLNKLNEEEMNQLKNLVSIIPPVNSIQELPTYVYEMPEE